MKSHHMMIQEIFNQNIMKLEMIFNLILSLRNHNLTMTTIKAAHVPLLEPSTKKLNPIVADPTNSQVCTHIYCCLSILSFIQSIQPSSHSIVLIQNNSDIFLLTISIWLWHADAKGNGSYYYANCLPKKIAGRRPKIGLLLMAMANGQKPIHN